MAKQWWCAVQTCGWVGPKTKLVKGYQCPACDSEDVFPDEEYCCPECKKAYSEEEGHKLGEKCLDCEQEMMKSYDYGHRHCDENGLFDVDKPARREEFPRLVKKPPRKPKK